MQALIKKERWPGGYSRRGIPLVRPGQAVLPDQPVLRMQRSKDSAPLGDELLPAGLHGRVVEITARGGVLIESHSTIVYGALGAGSQVAGTLTLWRGSEHGAAQTIPPGAILAVPGQLTLQLLRRALDSGVVGVVAASIALRDFEGFLRTDLVQLLSSINVEAALTHLPPLTVMLTEGIGSLAMPDMTRDLFIRHQGSIALLSGLTSVRWGLSPDLYVSLPPEEAAEQPAQPARKLTYGTRVYVRSGEHQGTTGIVDYLFVYPQVFASGVKARSVRLALMDGTFLIVPQIHVEPI
ncbi:MAG: hypothetical protein J2P37_10530 [Ktedonobacteraceae bacterium]|nr:hypothetical protein [Ktedonobacteraceae bacterium]